MPVSEGAPSRRFDLIVIGAGSGNSLIGPEFSGWSIALIDDGDWFGGTCLNAGCIPTKMFVHVADVAADAEHADRIGLSAAVEPLDWARVRDRVFARTDAISFSGLRYREQDCPNVTVFRQSVRFLGRHTIVTADGERLTAPRIVVAAGSRPRPLSVPHERDDGIHDSNSIMRIRSLPESLTILGGGAVAAEFAHVFSAFGTEVTVVVRGQHMLSHLDDDVSASFTGIASENWRVLTGETVTAVDRVGEQLCVTLSSGTELQSELVLVAHGRVPNTDTLGAAEVGFDLEPDGRLVVDGQQRALSGGRPVDGVYALGDVDSVWQLKHVANHEARIVAHNLAHPDAPVENTLSPVPAVVFTLPQVAHVGLAEREAREMGLDAVAVTQPYGSTAWGWALEDTTSFAKLVVERGTGILLGAHIIGPESSILIQPLVQAATERRDIRGLARGQYWPHPAPTEVIENALLKAEEAL